MTRAAPIEIIGGGLAGLSLGLALRREAVPVTIIEAGEYPRHRVCGEFITGLGSGTVARLGLAPFLDDARRHRSVGWFAGEKPVQIQQIPEPALGLSRYALDARIARAFVAAGGELRCRTRLARPDDAPGRVIATGRRRGRSPWLGLKIHVEALELAEDLELHLGDHAYVGLAGIEDGRVNVCGLFRRRAADGQGPALLLGYLRAAGLDALATRIAAGKLCPESFSAVAALEFSQRIVPTDRLEIGDAGGMIPPFTGNGMSMAFQSAEVALDPLLGYAHGRIGWADARQAIHTALHRHFRLRLASAGALHPFLLRPSRQRFVAALGRARLLPFKSLYATLH